MSGFPFDAADGGIDEPHTLGRWLTDRARSAPEKIAIDDRGVTISYGRLEERAVRLAVELHRAGYGPGDRIATLSGNSIDHVVAFFACAKTGIAFAPLSWRLRAHEVGALIDRAAPALLLIDDEYAALAGDALRHVPEPPATALLGGIGVEVHVPAREGGGAPLRPVRDEDPLLIIFTSGSEGVPKGVVLTHANCFWNNLSLAGAIQLSADDVVLAMLPQFHIAAWNVQPLLAWWVGATVVLERGFQPARALALIRDRGVTVMMGVPTTYRLLADEPGFNEVDLSGLRVAQVGGAAMPEGLAETWADHAVALTPGYGLTEASPNVLRDSGAHGAGGPAATPYPHVNVRLVDPQTGLVLEGAATGELQVGGPGVFAGYLDDVTATARAMAGEWLRTGDVASRDAHGRYRIVDRLKDIYISGGENVAPAEVEAALLRHPLIVDAAVVPVPDRVWGERGFAFVVRRPGVALSEDEVLSHARAQLAGFKTPVRVAFLAELPRTPIGKVQRARLRSGARQMMEEVAHEQS